MSLKRKRETRGKQGSLAAPPPPPEPKSPSPPPWNLPFPRLPTVDDSPPLPESELKSVVDSGVLATALLQSRELWVQGYHFPKVWKPTRRGRKDPPPSSQYITTRLGVCPVVIGPHIFPEARFLSVRKVDEEAEKAVKAAKAPAPKPKAPPAPRMTPAAQSNALTVQALTEIASKSPEFSAILTAVANKTATPEQHAALAQYMRAASLFGTSRAASSSTPATPAAQSSTTPSTTPAQATTSVSTPVVPATPKPLTTPVTTIPQPLNPKPPNTSGVTLTGATPKPVPSVAQTAPIPPVPKASTFAPIPPPRLIATPVTRIPPPRSLISPVSLTNPVKPIATPVTRIPTPSSAVAQSTPTPSAPTISNSLARSTSTSTPTLSTTPVAKPLPTTSDPPSAVPTQSPSLSQPEVPVDTTPPIDPMNFVEIGFELTEPGERLLIPRHTILEKFLSPQGGNNVLASFIITISDNKVYIPITLKLSDCPSRIWETLHKYVYPPPIVVKEMERIMKECKRFEKSVLQLRIPVDEESFQWNGIRKEPERKKYQRKKKEEVKEGAGEKKEDGTESLTTPGKKRKSLVVGLKLPAMKKESAE